MKKRMAMAVMALAVSAMAGSAFAADEPGKTTSQAAPQNTVKAQLVTMPAISLEQMAKEKGMTVEALIAQLQKEGKLIKATKALETVSIKSNDGSKPVESTKTIKASTLKMAHKDADGTKMMEVINLEDLAKEKGITVDELISQLEKEGKITKAVPTIPAVLDLEKMAKEQSITVEELIAKLQKEGKLAQAVKLVPAAPVQK